MLHDAHNGTVEHVNGLWIICGQHNNCNNWSAVGPFNNISTGNIYIHIIVEQLSTIATLSTMLLFVVGGVVCVVVVVVYVLLLCLCCCCCYVLVWLCVCCVCVCLSVIVSTAVWHNSTGPC